MPGPSDSKLEWEARKSMIMDLYSTQEKELPEVMKIMKEVHGFVASMKMYKKHLKAWGVKKNIPASDMIPMIRIAEQRRGENKETLFTCRGRLVQPGKLRRFAKRHKLMAHGADGAPCDEQVATPPEITYTTPEPDPSGASVLPDPRPRPYMASDNKGTEMSGTKSTSGCLNISETPSSRTMSWVPSTSVTWPANVTYPGPQPTSALPVMINHFNSSAFSGPQMQDISHNFPHHSMESSLSPDPWLDPVEDTNYHGPPTSNGIPPWNFVSAQAQHAVPSFSYNLDRGASAFSNDYNPSHMSPAILGMPNNLSAAGRSALEHTPLHNAVIYNDLSLARALLDAGANANCAARGGMTPLHYASFQRNIEMVKLLKDFGANLDALTDKGRSVLFFAARSEARLRSSDMLPYAGHSLVGQGILTDEATMGVIDALYNFPAGWARLLRSLDLADKDGVTPLMAAAEGGFEQTAVMFLQRGARPDVRDHAGHTALKYAASADHRPLVRLLLEADARVEAHDLSHLLKLANNNFTARDLLHGDDGWWDGCQNYHSVLIAEEMVRLCHERRVLDRLIKLAEQKRKAGVLELLRRVMAQEGIQEGSGSGSGAGVQGVGGG